MTTRHKGQEFAIVIDYVYGQPALAFLEEDGFFSFSDGDVYTPENLELSFGDSVRYLTLHQLEDRLFTKENP